MLAFLRNHVRRTNIGYQTSHIYGTKYLQYLLIINLVSLFLYLCTNLFTFVTSVTSINDIQSVSYSTRRLHLSHNLDNIQREY